MTSDRQAQSGNDRMKIVVLDRQQGKTTALLEWLRQAPEGEHRVLVSHTSQRAMDLYRSTFDQDNNPTWAESWQFVGVQEINAPGAMSGVLRGRGGQVVLGLDDLDLMLHALFRFPVGAITMKGEADHLGRTAELDRIAEKLAEQKADGTARRFDDVDAIREHLGRTQGGTDG